MGHATSRGDKVSSAMDYEKYIVPIVKRGSRDRSSMTTQEEAQDIAVGLACDHTADELRATIGDCALGVMTALITSIPEAVSMASLIHMDPKQQNRIASFGGLFVGAEYGITQRELRPTNG